MIIFLYGQDEYRAKQKLNEIINGYKKVHKSGLNLRYLDFSKGESFLNLRNEAYQSSMFQEKKLIIITNSFLNVGFKEGFLKQAKDFIKSNDIIVFYEQDVDKRSSLFKFLKKQAKNQEFEPLDGQKLRNWIKKEIGENRIDPLAIQKLVEYVGSDLWRLSNEIKKLVSFKSNEEIKVKDVETLVRSKIETDIFKTIDAMGQKDKKQALKLLHKHLEIGDSPLYLLSMINFQFRNLLILKDLTEKQIPFNVILKKSGLHPFVAKKSYFQSQQFTFTELKKIYQKIFQVDLNIKTGRINPEMALDLLIAEI